MGDIDTQVSTRNGIYLLVCRKIQTSRVRKTRDIDIELFFGYFEEFSGKFHTHCHTHTTFAFFLREYWRVSRIVVNDLV